jgi:hydrogenase maturation protease
MIHLVCFGNPYLGDDAVGTHVARILAAADWPTGVRVCDAGIAGLNAVGCFEGCARVIVIDAMRTGRLPGTVAWLDPAALAAPVSDLSNHLQGVASLLAILPLALDGPVPPIEVLGVEVAEVGRFTERLSPAVAEAIPKAAAAIRDRVDAWLQAARTCGRMA